MHPPRDSKPTRAPTANCPWQVTTLAAAFCNVAADLLGVATSELSCTARVLNGGLARRRLLVLTEYSVEAALLSGASINASVAATLSTVDGADLFAVKLNAAIGASLGPAVVKPAWNVIADVPVNYYQMELLSPSAGLHALNGSFVLKITVPNTYLDGIVALTFQPIANGSDPIVHTYTVPFISYTRTDFMISVNTKDHPTAPLNDGTYELFVDYKMRKYGQLDFNASVQMVIDFDDCANNATECNNGTCVNGVDAYNCDCGLSHTHTQMQARA